MVTYGEGREKGVELQYIYLLDAQSVYRRIATGRYKK